jgi:hypothetical protein
MWFNNLLNNLHHTPLNRLPSPQSRTASVLLSFFSAAAAEFGFLRQSFPDLQLKTVDGSVVIIDRDAAGEIMLALEDSAVSGSRRLLSETTTWTAVVTSQSTSGTAYVSPTSPTAATNPSADEKITCKNTFSCIFSTLDLANTQKDDPRFALSLGTGLTGGNKIDLFGSFSPASFVKSLASLTGKALCALTPKGSSIKKAGVDLGWLSSVSLLNDAASFISLFSKLPVVEDDYYMIGMFATGIPGITTGPLPAMQIVSAFNPCKGDYRKLYLDLR